MPLCGCRARRPPLRPDPVSLARRRPETLRVYRKAVAGFLSWCEQHAVGFSDVTVSSPDGHGMSSAYDGATLGDEEVQVDLTVRGFELKARWVLIFRARQREAVSRSTASLTACTTVSFFHDLPRIPS